MLRPQVAGLAILIWALLGVSWAQSGEAISTTPTVKTKSSLETLEDLGISLLSSLLSPSPTPSLTTLSSNTSSSATITASSLSSLEATKRTASPTASISSSVPAPSATESSSPHMSRTVRNMFIVLGTVLGAFILIFLVIVIWQCCVHRKKKAAKRRTASTIDYDEYPDSWQPAPYVHPMVTRPTSLHSGERYYTPPPPPPPPPPHHHRNSSNASLIPTMPTPPPPQHFRSSSSSGLVNPFDDQPYGTIDIGYSDSNTHHSPVSPVVEQSDRYSHDSQLSRHSRRSINAEPVELPENQVMQAVPDRVPTPMFGREKAPGEGGRVPSVPPPRNPQRRSLPTSPLANEFDFGFEQEAASRNARFSSSSRRNLNDAYHRF